MGSKFVTEPAHSLLRQSIKSKERREPVNGDGFGLAWYNHELSEAPGLYKSISPAWSNPNLLNLCRMTASKTILAHVRAATFGLPVSQPNCHPFVYDNFAFMHNGEIPQFYKMKRELLSSLSDEIFEQIRGSTDS